MRIEIKCQGADAVPYKDLIPFQGNLKDLSKENYQRLRKEIIELGFSEPVSIWMDKGKKYLLNGHQRCRTVKQMVEQEGFDCPPLPVSTVEAKDYREAKRKVLALTSQYGEITKQGLYEFMSEAEITMPEIEDSFRFPEIDFDIFKTEFFEEPTEGLIEDDEIPDAEESRVKAGDLWLLGEHRLFCGDCTVKENVERLMSYYECDCGEVHV